MGPKRGAYGSNDNEDQDWRTNIENAILDDETWRVKVIMIEAAGADQDRIYLNKFESFAAEERRFVVKNICKTETIFMVNQLGGEKKVKDDSLRVFEEGQTFLKEKKPIPSDLLALIIKHLILKMKLEYLFIKRQRLETKEGLRRESLIMVSKEEIKGSVGKKFESQESILKEGRKRGAGSANEVKPVGGKKYNTSLRLRGEEWRDKIYVDDYPVEGPNVYVALTGFLDAELPVYLLKFGVPLTSIVQLKIDPDIVSVPSSLYRITKRQSQTELFSDTTQRFWEQLQELRVRRATTDIFRNTAFIVFGPPYHKNSELTGKNDVIYDDLCFLMYDIQDLSRQHQHYIDNMTVVDIPEEQESIRRNNDYHEQIDIIPLECITLYSVLDSMLQTVSDHLEICPSTLSYTNNSLPSSPQAEERRKIKNAKAMVKDVFDILCKSEDCKQYRVTYGEEYENNKDPIIIRNGDFAKYKTFHLRNPKIDEIVWSSLFAMPINNLWRNTPTPSEETENKINFHFNILMSSFDRDNLETSETIRLIHLLAFRKLYNNRSSLKKRYLPNKTLSEFKKTYLKRSELAEPLPKCPSVSKVCSSALNVTTIPNSSQETLSEEKDNSGEGFPERKRVKVLFDCPDLTELVSAAEIANEKPLVHLIDDYEYFEDFCGTCAFQVMLEAFNNYNCVDCKYCEVTDCYLLMFYNSHDKDGVSREEWRNHIDTPVALQDFFDFVIDEHYDWIKYEEHCYDENLKLDTQTALKDSLTKITRACIDNTEVGAELIIEGSLKHRQYDKIREPASTVSMEDTDQNSRKTSITETNLTKTSKKSKSTPRTISPQKQPTQSKDNSKEKEPSVECVKAIKPKPFLGYSLGDRRVEVFGKECSFFSKDGTKVHTEYKLFIPTNQEYISLLFVPGNYKTEFRLHKTFGEGELSPQVAEICDSFRITCEDEMIINIKKQTYTIEQPINDDMPQDISNKYNTPVSTSGIKIPTISDTYSYYSFVVGWPNGLMCESIYPNKSSNLSHIKQFYTDPLTHLKEDMRCITLNGEVIIFNTDGTIQVLHPEGTYTLIKRCEMRLVTHMVAQETQSEGHEKKKKDKDKGKSHKAPSKIKLPTIVEDPAATSEYELKFDEFERIDTSGMKKRWIGNTGVEIEKLLIKTATDFCQGEIFSKRSDGTTLLLNRDGIQIVTFPRGTRIISEMIIEEDEVFVDWTDAELRYLELFDLEEPNLNLTQKSNNTIESLSSVKLDDNQNHHPKQAPRLDGFVSITLNYSIEHERFATVNVNKSNNKVTIESPNKTSLILDSENHYEILLDSATSAKFNGETLDIDYVACPDCRVNTQCEIKISEEVEFKKRWLKLTDSFGKTVTVTYEGTLNTDDMTLSDEVCKGEHDMSIENIEEEVETIENPNTPVYDINQESQDKIEEIKSESSFGTHDKCIEKSVRVNYPRFFVLRRDLSCSEVIHRVLIEQYKTACQWQPWCSYNEHDTFGGHRKLYSILSPVSLTETEKWYVESRLANKPLYLEYKDLKKDTGKGFYHWMRPYERFVPETRKPSNVLPPRQPKAFILRTLEKQWTDEEREELKGARELLAALLKYRKVLETDCASLLTIPIRDLRNASDRQTDHFLRRLAERIYDDLKARLDEDILCRTRATITTKPSLPASLQSVAGDEMDEEHLVSEGVPEEPNVDFVKEIEEIEKLSPNLAKYWRHRVEAAKEEEFFKYLLRAGTVPPYFQNLLGGAIWWEVNNLATNAILQVARKKTGCTCSQSGEAEVMAEETIVETPHT